MFDFGLAKRITNADAAEVMHEYGLPLHSNMDQLAEAYDAIILAVAHKEFLSIDWRSHLLDNGVLYDVKGVLEVDSVDARL